MNAKCFMLLILFPIGLCQANTLSITGNITAAPCVIDSINANQTVEFSQIIARKLSGAHNTSEWKYLDLKLSNCPISTSFVKAQFMGKVDEVSEKYFANSGTAENVALQLTDKNHSITYNNLSIAKVSIDKDRRAIFPLSARIIAPKGDVKGGSFTSVVQIAFTYE